MDHISSEHLGRGHTLEASRPEFGLYQHLWNKCLIDDTELKELKGGNYMLSRAPESTMITRRETDRRRVRSQHVDASRRSDIVDESSPADVFESPKVSLDERLQSFD